MRGMHGSISIAIPVLSYFKKGSGLFRAFNQPVWE